MFCPSYSLLRGARPARSTMPTAYQRQKPSQLTYQECARRNWKADRVDRFFSGVARDLFGFLDFIALDPHASTIVGIQATTTNNQAARLSKITSDRKCSEIARLWLECGGRIEVWGWGLLLVKRGGKARRWVLTRNVVRLDDLNPPPSF